MDSDLSEKNNNLTWWWKQLRLSEDWNSMPVSMRQDLVKKLKRGIHHILDVDIPKEDLIELIKMTDLPTVWDAVISTCALSPKERDNRFRLWKYVKTTALNIWRTNHPSRQRSWQSSPENDKKRKSKPVSWKKVEANDSNNFKKGTDRRGRPLKVTNDIRDKIVELRADDNYSIRDIKQHLAHYHNCSLSVWSIHNITQECNG